MKKEIENENDVIEITDEEMYSAAVYARTNGLISIINEEIDKDAHLSLGANGFPCIDAIVDGINCRISYFPVGDVDTDRFILMIRAAILEGDDGGDHTSRLFACESYNVGSVFGSAVFIPTDGSVEFRVMIPESGGLSEDTHYGFVFDMLKASVQELKETLEES